MKKMLLFIALFFGFITNLNAACDYSTQKEYNVLSSYVSYKLDYVESSNTFRVTIYNLAEPLLVEYENVTYPKSNSETVINGLEEGKQVTIEILTNNKTCVTKNIRNFYINIPYVNPYYNSDKCKGHDDIKACSSKFLDYQISESTFLSLFNKTTIDNSKKVVTNDNEDDGGILKEIITFLSNIFIPTVIVILSSLITVLIFLPIYRKVKYGM